MFVFADGGRAINNESFGRGFIATLSGGEQTARQTQRKTLAIQSPQVFPEESGATEASNSQTGFLHPAWD
jgi:hypothetical protein